MPKARCFYWLDLQKNILTSEKLQIYQPFNCVLFHQEKETVDHLLLQCSFAQQCWQNLMEKLDISMPLQNTMWELFQSWPILFKSSHLSCIWNIIANTIVWSIWWERNKIIFRKVVSPIDKVNEILEKNCFKISKCLCTKTQ